MATLCEFVGEIEVWIHMAEGKPWEHGYMKLLAFCNGHRHFCFFSHWFWLGFWFRSRYGLCFVVKGKGREGEEDEIKHIVEVWVARLG